ncbi:MAG: CRISPR-associated endonuclease Cas1 [Thermoplasmatales archaeon]
MKDYYVFQNSQLDADESILRVVSGSEQRRLPVEEVAGIHLLAGYSLTSGVLELAAKYSFPIHVYSYYGDYRGTFFPPPVEPTASILVSQVMSHVDGKRRFEIGREIIHHAEDAMDALLTPFGLTLPGRAEGNTTEELLLSEARIRKEYYALLDTVLPPFWSIVTRQRHPPRRPADALLSFANGIIYAKMNGYIHRSGLDPRVGYLHGDERASNPLALDLAEMLKPVLSEGVLLHIASTGSENSLITNVNEGTYLNEAGKKTVIRFVEDTLQQSVRPVGYDREDKVLLWATSMPRKLHRAIVMGDLPKFPVIPCTLSSHTMQILKSGRTFVP